MSLGIDLEWDEAKWNAWVKRIESKLTPGEIQRKMLALSYRGLRMAVEAMPKRTGALKRSWTVREVRPGEHLIYSMSKVALFLEEGTRAHGPRRAKHLYIPLRPGAATWRKGFVYGEDYILVKWVKGITALKYLKPLSDDTRMLMVQEFEKMVSEV